MMLARLLLVPRRARNVLGQLTSDRLAMGEAGVLARPRAWLHGCRTVWRARADILAFLRSGDEALAYALRHRFGLGARLGAAQPVPGDLFQAPSDRGASPPATIIIPVFNAAAAVERLLTHLPGTLPDGQPVLLVDDGSTDPEIGRILTRFLEVWSETTILRQPRNRGFVASVNAAFKRLPPGHHAILLNSDTLPPADWVPRLLAPLVEGRDVASVTPLSNAAEILSVPRAGVETSPDPVLIEAMDQVARCLAPREIMLPTGIGFCMALHHRFLAEIGGFDPGFGPGYGEEVDWCQRAKAVGGRHLAATNLVVGHQGAASFGDNARRARMASAQRILDARHPGYAAAALDWENRDPIAAERLAVALAWAAHRACAPVPIFLAHSLGGGAETALQAEIDAARRNGTQTVIILRVGGRARWRVELCHTRFSLAGDLESDGLMHELLAPLEERHVIYSCGVHATNPAGLPEVLLRLAEGHRLSVRFHDFFPISPSWTLIGADGRFRGVPPKDSDDPTHALPGLSHREWRARWGRVMARADEIAVFSGTSRDLVCLAYPESRDWLALQPHELIHRPQRLRPGGQTLGVLGGINHAKGGSVLERLSREGGRRIALIGGLDDRFSLPRPHIVHGSYDREKIAALARAYDVGAWFIPSIWPETFSFATHEAIATGLPVACFDLGAQAEAVGRAATGHVLNADPGDIAAIAVELETLFH